MNSFLHVVMFAVALAAALWPPIAGRTQETSDDAHGEAPVRGSTSVNSVTSPSDTASDKISEDNALIATKLFLEGRALLNHGKPQEACTLLARSQQLVPSLGTLLNLGLCHESSDRLATAHDYYRRAEIMATRAGDEMRQEFAHQQAAALAARRATLTLRLSPDAPRATELRMDDVILPREIWDQPLYVDAGEHWIRVEAQGRPAWAGSVHVQDGGKHVVVIPQLGPNEHTPVRPASEQPNNPEMRLTQRPERALVASPPLARDTGPNARRVIAVSAAGLGLAALGTGVIYAIVAKHGDDKSVPYCHPNNACDPPGVKLRADALADARRATWFAVSGGTALLGGVVLWFLSPGDGGETLRKQFSIAADGGSVGATFRAPL